ncbi:MAG: FAD-dependent oxidoreductase, partial [Syntrophaceae bacterium]|nr:FAD-dependent oxidoreductase [Syntrophaceae bacterium]
MLGDGCEDLTILGGGASGICVGYYARQRGLSFRIHEATDSIGGNAATIRFKDFLFDSGAHRWHDRYPEITAELKEIMGPDFRRINVPSHIYSNNESIDFPLSPLNLLKTIGFAAVVKAGFEVVCKKVFNGRTISNFEDFAIDTYGRSIAERFLINYSEKLWGRPCRLLSPRISGKRMKGLDLRTFVQEALLGSKAKTRHLDGSFYYPRYGIGDIVGKWVEKCGRENIICRSRITRIYHNGRGIHSIEINGRDAIRVAHVVNTLPVTFLLNMLKPSLPKEILDIGNALDYRHVKLVAIFVDKPRVTRFATVYFPDKDFIFTRLYEPKNRSADMAPETKTSLVAEVPCRDGSACWNMKDSELIEKVSSKLIEIGWIRGEDILDAVVHPMHY